MNTPIVNASAVNEAEAQPNFFEEVRGCLPAHSHVDLVGTPGSRMEATWSTPGGVWQLSAKAVGAAPGGTLKGPGGNLTFPAGTSAGQVACLLRGIGSLPDIGGLAPETDQATPGGAQQSRTALVEALQPFLPEHAHITQGAMTEAAAEADRYPTVYVANTVFGNRIEWTPSGGPNPPRWSAAWTNPLGQFRVELNPRDPSRTGLVVTSPWGAWHLPTPGDHFMVLSVLRGLGGLPLAASGPDRMSDAATSPHSPRRYGAAAGRSRAETLTRWLRAAMEPNTVSTAHRPDGGRWINVDVAAAMCAAHILTEETRNDA